MVSNNEVLLYLSIDEIFGYNTQDCIYKSPNINSYIIKSTNLSRHDLIMLSRIDPSLILQGLAHNCTVSLWEISLVFILIALTLIIIILIVL